MFGKINQFIYLKMNMVGMGASMLSAVVAVGALAYALTLEARILTNDARSYSTCETVSFLKRQLVYIKMSPVRCHHPESLLVPNNSFGGRISIFKQESK